MPINTYAVTSTSDSNHVTNVYVTGTSNAVSSIDGVTPVGVVSATQTLVNSAGNTTVPLTVEADAFGPISGSASLSVVTAEAASVQDTKPYAPITLSYNINNVGYAATGGVSTSNSNVQNFGAPLSATFSAGSEIAPSALNGSSLSSFVGYVGSAGSLSSYANYVSTNTLATAGTVNSSNVYGVVGSEADILASTMLAASTTISMAWRARDNAENGSFLDPSYKTILPAGVKWLASDVVDIEGVGAASTAGDPTFAMQMSYDDGINTFLGGPPDTASVAGSYIAKLVNGKWENAVLADSTTGAYAVTGGTGSLTAFLQQYYVDDGYTLQELAGSWGVDLADQESWAIINCGSGDFAVVPEPSTFALLGAGAAGLFWYRIRRKKHRIKTLPV